MIKVLINNLKIVIIILVIYKTTYSTLYAQDKLDEFTLNNCVCPQCLFTFGTKRMFRIVDESMNPVFKIGTCPVFEKINNSEKNLNQGDIIAFLKPQIDKNTIWVSRLIAFENQTVQLINGKLIIDEIPIKTEFVKLEKISLEPNEFSSHGYRQCLNGRLPMNGKGICERNIYSEKLNNKKYYVLDTIIDNINDNTPKITVEKGTVFVMGDHRDNSIDSRPSLIAGGGGMILLNDIQYIFRN